MCNGTTMEYYFILNMSHQDFLPYYKGQIHSIAVTTTKGVKVQFPAMHLRQYVTTEGVHGFYCMKTQNNKFLSIIKLSD